MTTPQRPVRVRIAPSPTGDPHIGTAYIALFNYVFAKKHGGQFILRIEDTDQNRARADSEAMILDAVRWVGLPWDEGPDVGGPFGPYRQSERTPIYRQHADLLLEKGHAYRCFCSPERLENLRKAQVAQKQNAGYDRHCRRLSAAEIQAKLGENVPYTIRMKVPEAGVVVVKDLLRGPIEFENATIDDQVLLKSDGFPTYHLANVVDDHLMEMTHVIRGEEWISSTPKHVHLYAHFGWEPPEFCHLPLLRNADKSKISKRKNPTSINYYRRKGILPEALRNFLALMGWSFGADREIFTTNEMIEHFTWERATLGGPVFDLTKLSWMNGQYLRNFDDARYLSHVRSEIFSENYLARIIPLVKDRVEKFEDFVTVTDFFFAGDLNYDAATLIPKGRTAADTARVLGEVMDKLEALDGWVGERIQKVCEAYLAETKLKPKDVYMPLRIAVTGRKESPPLFETVAVVGKEMVRRRTRLAIDFLNTVRE